MKPINQLLENILQQHAANRLLANMPHHYFVDNPASRAWTHCVYYEGVSPCQKTYLVLLLLLLLAVEEHTLFLKIIILQYLNLIFRA